MPYSWVWIGVAGALVALGHAHAKTRLSPSVSASGGERAAAVEAAVEARSMVSAASRATPEAAAVETRAKALSALEALPLRFERNVGQADERAGFIARGPGHALFLLPTEAVLCLRAPDGAEGPAPRITIRPVGALETARLEGLEPLPGAVSAFTGADPARHRTSVPTFAKVRAAGVYPGVDLVWHGSRGRLEYDFVVLPGADPATVRLAFEGARDVRLDAPSGDLLLDLPGGVLRQPAPIVYQEREGGGDRDVVAGRYVVAADDLVRFEIGAYDGSRPLVIDPAIVWATYMGGGGADDAFAVDVDAAGNVYVAGTTLSTDLFDVAGGPVPGFQPTKNAGSDAFVAKIAPDGQSLVFATYLGGSLADGATAVRVEASGNVTVVGRTFSNNFPVTANAFQTVKGIAGPNQTTQADGFVTKLDPTGTVRVFSTYLGGSATDEALAVDVDANGQVYVTGFTESVGGANGTGRFPARFAQSLQSTFGGGQEAFAAVLQPSGRTVANNPDSAVVYVTFLGGTSSDRGQGIAVDGAGAVYVAGKTLSPALPFFNQPPGSPVSNPTTPRREPAGGLDAFLVKVNPVPAGGVAAGVGFEWFTFLGGIGSDDALGLRVDASGAYLVGTTSSVDFPAFRADGLPPFQSGYGGGASDAFVAKVGSTGSLVYGTYLGHAGEERGIGIAIDAAGNTYLTGQTDSANFPVVDPIQPTNELGSFDAFVTKLDAGGSALLFSTYYGGSQTESGLSIAVAGDHVVFAGNTDSMDLDLVNPLDQIYGDGQRDGFVARFDLSTTPPPPPPANNEPVADAGLDRTIECQGLPTAELLDGTGSFDADGDALSFRWTVRASPAGSALFIGKVVATGDAANAARVTVQLDKLGLYVFGLAVGDGQVESVEDTVDILLQDTTPPVVLCPGDMTFETGDQRGVVVTFQPTVTDNVDPSPTVVISHASGSFFAPGRTVVTVTATDGSGNSAGCSFAIGVTLVVPIWVDPGVIRLRRRGFRPQRVDVVVYSTPTFSAQILDPRTITVNGALPQRQGRTVGRLRDVNGDGRRDLVLELVTADLNLQPGANEVVLTGLTVSGGPVRGADSVFVIDLRPPPRPPRGGRR